MKVVVVVVVVLVVEVKMVHEVVVVALLLMCGAHSLQNCCQQARKAWIAEHRPARAVLHRQRVSWNVEAVMKVVVVVSLPAMMVGGAH